MQKQLIAAACLLLLSPGTWAATVFGALAVDRSNGFYYGWSHDYPNPAQANSKALSECAQRGGSCSVVLELSGADRCGAYHTVEGTVGTSYGWGKGPDQATADRIAAEECSARANGQSCSNQVWACNATGKATAKTPVDLAAIRAVVADYYDTQGEWAGKFRMNVEKIRVEGSGPTIQVHVRYIYFPIPGNPNPSGYDQRVFTIDTQGKVYRVSHMGPYMSGTF